MTTRSCDICQTCVCVSLQESDLDSIEVLQTLNSLFSTGELPTLFSNDEMSGILQVCPLRPVHTTL